MEGGVWQEEDEREVPRCPYLFTAFLEGSDATRSAISRVDNSVSGKMLQAACRQSLSSSSSVPEASSHYPKAADTDNFDQRLLDFAVNSRRHRKSKGLQANDVQNEEDSSAVVTSVDSDEQQQRSHHSRHRFVEPRYPSRITIRTAKGHPVSSRQKKRKQSSLPQQQSKNLLTPLAAGRLSMRRHDCDGADCLKNNRAVSLYVPPKNNTHGKRQPPLLLLSNNPVKGRGKSSSDHNNGSTRGTSSKKRHRPHEGAPRKSSSLHTGLEVLGPEIHQTQSQLGASYYTSSRTNSYQPPRYGGAEGKSLEEQSLAPPPFAGGAELTDFIQPGDSATTTRIYDVSQISVPKRRGSAKAAGAPLAYYGANRLLQHRHQQQHPAAPHENRSAYGALLPAPLLPQETASDSHAPAIPLFQQPAHSIYSTYPAQSPGPTPPPHYQPRPGSSSQVDAVKTAT
ncbi:unnamed protein product [Gongylonema pulchrum]|uniref:Cyclin-dependent kinase 5 activator 1 n=1 Tax=Gongylonema pulchrum TaxID=637853 RepID=A0A183CV12_9BILA|nr:unnamed protein product [Gongylonema pulchrum]